MINYNDPDIFLLDSTQKDLLITDGTVTVSGDDYTVTGATVTITNSILETEAFELKQSLSSDTQLRFGSCESASISFTIHDINIVSKGKTLTVYLIPNHEASKMLQIGVFKVEEDKLSGDRTKRNIVAYDALYDILNADVTDWYNTLLPDENTSVTLAQFRASFFSHFSVTVESTTLTNDNIIIARTIEPETLSGADVIKAICEINGVFGTITNEGKFRFLELVADINHPGLFPLDTLYPADNLYPANIDTDAVVPQAYYTDVQFEDYQVESITQLIIRNNEEDAGVAVGTSGNTYTITGNFLVLGYNATALTTLGTNILAKITDRYYTPCTVNALGNPLREIGDPLRIETKYRSVVMYMLERTLHGIQALRDTYVAQGEQYYSEQLNSVATQIKKKVDRDTIVIDLDGKMNNTITIKPDSITFGSDGALIVDTTNFKLDALGNASFSGDISGASISSSGWIGSYDSANLYARFGLSGLQIKDGNKESSLGSGYLTLEEGSSVISIDPDSGMAFYGGAHTIIINSSDGEITIDGHRVLTAT